MLLSPIHSSPSSSFTSSTQTSVITPCSIYALPTFFFIFLYQVEAHAKPCHSSPQTLLQLFSNRCLSCSPAPCRLLRFLLHTRLHTLSNPYKYCVQNKQVFTLRLGRCSCGRGCIKVVREGISCRRRKQKNHKSLGAKIRVRLVCLCVRQHCQ